MALISCLFSVVVCSTVLVFWNFVRVLLLNQTRDHYCSPSMILSRAFALESSISFDFTGMIRFWVFLASRLIQYIPLVWSLVRVFPFSWLEIFRQLGIPYLIGDTFEGSTQVFYLMFYHFVLLGYLAPLHGTVLHCALATCSKVVHDVILRESTIFPRIEWVEFGRKYDQKRTSPTLVF